MADATDERRRMSRAKLILTIGHLWLLAWEILGAMRSSIPWPLAIGACAWCMWLPCILANQDVHRHRCYCYAYIAFFYGGYSMYFAVADSVSSNAFILAMARRTAAVGMCFFCQRSYLFWAGVSRCVARVHARRHSLLHEVRS